MLQYKGLFFYSFYMSTHTDPLAQNQEVFWWNIENKERYSENAELFDKEYREKLENALWEEWNDLLWKIAGSFELSGNINNAVEINVDTIKNLEESQKVKDILLSIINQESLDETVLSQQQRENLKSDEENVNLETSASFAARQEKIDYQQNLWNNAKESLADDLALESDELDQKLNKTAEQEKNKDQMQTMIYQNESFMESFMWDKSQDIKQNKTLLEQPEVQDDLDNILAKCVLPVDADSVQEVYAKGWEKWVQQINKSLNYAFDMQIWELLDGKMNFPQETINNLCENIYSGNPMEKIVNYEKIKSIIHTNEWMGWAKQSREFRVNKQMDWVKQLVSQEQFQEVRKLLKEANQTTLDQLESKQSEIERILAMEKDEETSWDIFQSWEIDKISENLTNQKEAA